MPRIDFRIWTPFSFLTQAVQLTGSAFPLVIGRVAVFVIWAAVLAIIHHSDHLPDLNIEVAPYEAAGAVLALLMVLRTNGGYERWWEGRKLWGAIVNDTRSLAIGAAAYGPADPQWRARVAGLIIAFAHTSRQCLRNRTEIPEVAALLGVAEAEDIRHSDHMPSAVVVRLSRELRAGLSDFTFLQSDNLRVRLLDWVGGCERIRKTPLPLAYAIEVRRFIFLFLVTLPFVLFHEMTHDRALWLAPLVMLLVAYPLIAIDKIGHELQEPFEVYRLNHLPLDEICATIERNVLAILEPTSTELKR